jgi:5-hydroxyisourate hydrolase-like protein (transthyretin family)
MQGEKDNKVDAIKKLEDEIKKLHNDWEKQVMKIQYDKLVNDWRSFNNLIWAVPTVAIAIMSGMLIAAYRPEFDLLPQVRIVILSLGSLFLFALTVEVVKKRFHMNVITYLLQDLEEGLGLNAKFRFPLGTEDIDEYMERKGNRGIKKKPDDYSDPVFKFFKRAYARKYLTYIILISAISLALLAEWESIKLGKSDVRFYVVGVVVGVGAVTTTVSYYIYKNKHKQKSKLIYEKINSKLSVSAEVVKESLTQGDEQTLNVAVKDVKLNKPVVGAEIKHPSMLAQNKAKLKDGITDNEGRYSYTWTVGDTFKVGIYKVVVKISEEGYENAFATTIFEVKKIDVLN